MGMSYLTYLKRRKQLEEIGLLEVKIQHQNNTKIILKTDLLWGLIKFIRGSYKKYKTPTSLNDAKKLEEYIDTTRKSLFEALAKKGQLKLSHSIYSINTPKPLKPTTTHYPKYHYTIVLRAFQKYKGVKLYGPEINQHMRAIKTMFKSNRKPKEIVDFMKWLHDHEDHEQTPWVKSWTIWTVQKKLPEFVGGKLKVEKSGDGIKLT